jgi:hypothetical protein
MPSAEARSWLQQQLSKFYDEFDECKEFIKYFKETWEPKAGVCLSIHDLLQLSYYESCQHV